MEDKTVSCIADNWAGVNNWSAESVGTLGKVIHRRYSIGKLINFFIRG